MRALFTSDLHGHLPAYERFARLLAQPGTDLGVLGGDLATALSPDELQDIERRQVAAGQEEALLREGRKNRTAAELNAAGLRDKERQCRQILLSAGKPILFIMGNDDGLLDGEWEETERFVNLNQKGIRVGERRFVGYQYTTPFLGGAFEKSEESQLADLQRLRRIVDDRTVLVTHGPAYGLYDRAPAHPLKDELVSIGSRSLRWLIDEARPAWHLYGHIHHLYGWHGTSVNGAYPFIRKFVRIELDDGRCEWVE